MFSWKSLVIAAGFIATAATASATQYTSSGQAVTEAQAAKHQAAAAKATRTFRQRADANDSLWGLNFDWFCSGAPGYATVDVYGDYTFMTSDGYPGTWTRNKDDVVFTFDMGTVYTGTLDDGHDYASGTMMDPYGNSGCWTADRIY